MKTLLIRPPATYPKGSINPSAGIPLGLLSIGATLDAAGFAVEILDCQVHPDRPLLDAEDGSLHMGIGWEEVAESIIRSSPDIVGIGATFSAQLPNSLRMADLVRRLIPAALIVMGGNHPTVRPDDCFSMSAAVDLACIGEGELTMLEIVRARASGESTDAIAGTAYRHGSAAGMNPLRPRIDDLDSLPLPAYHLVNLEEYFRLYAMGFTERIARRYPGSERAVSLVTSRGCPFNCVFCSIHLHMGRKWRSHSVEYVSRHIELLESRYGVRHLHFEDDNLSADPRRFREILLLLRDRGRRLSWDTPNGVRVDTLNRELVELSKESGCDYLVFGVESGNDRVLREVIDKKLDLADVTAAARWCRDVGLDAMAFFVIGFPGESLEEMADTVRFALSLMGEFDVLPNLFVATPLPGTRLETECLQKGILTTPLTPADFAAMTQGGSFIATDTFTREQLAALLADFSRSVKRIFVGNAFRFLLRHPLTLLNFVREVAWLGRSLPLVKAAYRVLEFKNCLR
jgi:radical SAM superfamily enzyme YgiQ (UPF0313 family)